MAYTTIDKPTDYFNPVTYVGNGTDAHAITGVGFQPNWVWLKNRNDVNSHQSADSVRGATKILFVNENSAEGTYSNTIQSFDSDGFTVGTSSGANTNANNFISWNWLAGGTAVSNTDGSITSSVSANTTSGFSIVTYTGTGSLATVGHGLGSAPKMIIAKNRGSTSNWDCYHVGLSGANYRIQLNSNGAESISGGSWGSTAPTSTVFTVQDDTATNVNGNTYVAYCFAEKKGFSKFGSYTGNGSTDGTFVYTGFKPAWVLLKLSSVAGGWVIYDIKRDTFNVTDSLLLANSSNAESVTGEQIDILSNGFKARSSAFPNNSGQTLIYMAFAENPFVTSTGIPTTAR